MTNTQLYMLIDNWSLVEGRRQALIATADAARLMA